MTTRNEGGLPSQTLVLMAGSVGAGKSTLARALGERLGWPVIDKDVIKSRLLISELEGPIEGVTYEVSFDVCEQLLLQGFSVILDTPVRRRQTLDRGLRVGEQLGVEVKVLYCKASQAVRTSWQPSPS